MFPSKKYPVPMAVVVWRRFLVFGLMFIMTGVATTKWIMSMPSDSSIYAKVVMIVLFALTFGWIALFFISSLLGFKELLFGRPAPGLKMPLKEAEMKTRTAILMPVYNEAPHQVMGNLLAIAHDLAATPYASCFDIFVLSDTTNPKCWVAEEAVWNKARAMMPKSIPLYYRRRVKNTARKSGNIEDFCKKWGSSYENMIVLDADSLMTAKAIVQMVFLMEANPDAGIMQAPPQSIKAKSLFSRIQQFANKLYGPIVTAGLCYWQMGDSNYWGHNAIIRVRAFMDCCGLPVLPGKAPFGGFILSHDFVEAALIRRGGWTTWLLSDVEGSYEELPPTMIDFAARDRRWCQGNLQHLKIMLSKKLHYISRIHFTIGIMSYLSSALWFLFLVTGLAVALGREFFPPTYFSQVRSLFPEWPIFDKMGTYFLFGFSLFMLLFPKILGLIVYKVKTKKTHGICKSVLLEMFFSALIAPIMMLFQSKFIWDIVTGHSVSWNTQNRGDNGTSWKDAFNRHMWHTFLGLITTLIVFLYVPALFYWILPVTVGLVLSIPLSVLSSRVSWGNWFKRYGFFLTAEEECLPNIISEAERYSKKLSEGKEKYDIRILIQNPALNFLHASLLDVNGPSPVWDNTMIEQASIKLENHINHQVDLDLTPEEEVCLLYSPEVLERGLIIWHLKQRV